MFYITERGKPLDVATDPCFHTFGEAKERVDALHASFGTHFHVIKVETVWSTTTLADLMAEGRKV